MAKNPTFMTCTCCGEPMEKKYQQWWNQDRGHSLCALCAIWIKHRENKSDGDIIRIYGEEGIHRERVSENKNPSGGD